MTLLKVAIQKNGRLSEDSKELLAECGINFLNGTAALKTKAINFPIEALFLRDDDIPQYVEQKVADIGIIGENVFSEKRKDVKIIKRLGFAGCRLSLAIPKEETYTGTKYFMNKKIATSYPVILNDFLQKHQITAEVEEISGSVEIAPGIGLANAICDIVSSGSSLMANGLVEVETILKSEAVIIANKDLAPEKEEIINNLLFRIQTVKNAKENKYILLNAPESSVDEICKILPGMKSPTVFPLIEKGWCSVHSVVKENELWEKIDLLKKAGAENVLIVPVEKMIL